MRRAALRGTQVVYRRRLVVMVKAPFAGRVKTRLGAGLGSAAAAYFSRHLSRGVIGRLARDPRWETWLAVSPDEFAGSGLWGPVGGRHGGGETGQGRGDLGARMQRVFDRRSQRRWVGPVVIIGADIPAIGPDDIAAAFGLLGRQDVVIGPAPDGGYWLIGAKRIPRCPRPFAGVRWSSAHALEDTLANLGGLRVGLLRSIADVDTIDEWRLCRGWSGRRILPMW